MSIQIVQQMGYLISIGCFFFGLKWLGSLKTARTGNFISSCGMLMGVVVTLLSQEILSFKWIILGVCIGAIIGGFFASKVVMTSMPEMVALLNGFGGLSSLLVSVGACVLFPSTVFYVVVITIFSVAVGGITFMGSLVAWGKLSGVINTKPYVFSGQKIMAVIIMLGFVTFSFMVITSVYSMYAWVAIVCLSLFFGGIFVLAIGGGDMPVVIALLNSFSGIAASMAGMVIGNVVLLVAGLLVGSSGFILTVIMCKSMNRSLYHVLFGAMGSDVATQGDSFDEGDIQPISTEDACLVLEAARRVIVVPGYGMAVAQAQRSIFELSKLLEENGCEVMYAIHPVAGRMPGHMNVLLAEANVAYEQLIEMEDANEQLPNVDVVLVIGANDVVNPDAEENDKSPIYGMPIIEVYKAQSVFVLKRSMNPGFSGVQNPLFFRPNTRMLFGDAKTSIQQLIAEFK